mgnify:CR=1 FL=1
MTEMVYGSMPSRVTEPVLPRWWRTIDKWSMTAIMVLFAIGLLLGLAASVPLAERNGLDPFHYVQRQAFFGGLALAAMFAVMAMQFAAKPWIAVSVGAGRTLGDYLSSRYALISQSITGVLLITRPCSSCACAAPATSTPATAVASGAQRKEEGVFTGRS